MTTPEILLDRIKLPKLTFEQFLRHVLEVEGTTRHELWKETNYCLTTSMAKVQWIEVEKVVKIIMKIKEAFDKYGLD